MKPTKLTEKPFTIPTGKMPCLIFPTDIGPMTKEECAESLGIKPGTFYERYRRRHAGITLGQLSKRLFQGGR